MALWGDRMATDLGRGALEEVRRLDQAGARGVRHGIAGRRELARRSERARPDRGAGALAFLVHRVEVDVEVRLPVLVPHVLRQSHDPLQTLQRGLLGRHALPHELDHRMRPAGAQVAFAPPGRAAGPDVAVDEETRADDRRIAQTARNLEEETRRRRAAGDGPVGGDDVAVDRALWAEVFDAVLLDVPLDVGVRRLFVAPLDPVVLGGEL